MKNDHMSYSRHPYPPRHLRINTWADARDQIVDVVIEAGLLNLYLKMFVSARVLRGQYTRASRAFRTFADLFEEAAAGPLPPFRGDLDHAIEIIRGKDPPFGPLYYLSEAKPNTSQ